MEAVLAVIVGVVFGSALAAAVAFPLRRRRLKAQPGRAGRTRRIPLQHAHQRQRAAIVAASFAFGAAISQLAGWPIVAAYFMLGAVFLCAQAATSAVLTRNR